MTVLRSRASRYARPAAVTAARVALIGTVLAVLAVGCGNRSHERSPARLADGTRAPPLPAVLADVSPRAVSTRVRVLDSSELGARGRECLQRFRPEFSVSPSAPVVERTGTIGTSITLRDVLGHVVLGCDATDARATGRGDWCAHSVGRLYDGRLRDPRVDILCHLADGERVGFAWIEPAQATRWIVSRTERGVEIFEVAAGLPVRLATADVDVATSSATFDVTEYGVDGREVRRGRLQATVAG